VQANVSVQAAPTEHAPFSKAASYALAVLATGAVALARGALDPWLREQAILLPFVLAVLAAAVAGGLGPGLVATGLAMVVAAVAFFEPRGFLALADVSDAVHLAVFAGVSVVICLLSHRLRQARTRAIEVCRELRDSHEQLRAIADSMPHFVWSARPDGLIEYFNQRWYEYTAMPHTSNRQADWTGHVHEADRDRVADAWGQATATGEPFDLEFRVTRASDSATRWFLGRALPIRNDRGEIVRWFGTCTDIDERRRLAEAHEGRLAAERAARAQVETAMRQRDEFVATLAHELRTPLNVILGWTQMLPRSTDPDRLARGLEIIERNTRAEAQIISDLLDIGCVTSGRIRMGRAPVPLVAAFRAALSVVRPGAEAKRVRIDAAADPDAVVMADATRLQQIVWNLLSNAVKFTAAGGRIELTARCVADSVELSVNDSGQGIDPAFLPFVFDRYRQADGSPTRSHGGLGLGLSLAKYLVELHGGTIEARSEGTGRGATFIVRLPAAGRDEDAAGACVRVSLAGAHVLVVEDQPDGLAFVSRILLDRGGRVSMAASAAEALERFDRYPPDLIVSDIDMPGMSGFELLTELRAREHGRRVPAIALTPFARAEDRTRSLMAGYQGHVPKPVDPAELLATVASLLHLADRADEVPSPRVHETRGVGRRSGGSAGQRDFRNA
jgi:PAS domain S-box-containing protein